MKPLTVITSSEPDKTFTERYGGWILSVCFHVMLFAALLIARPPARFSYKLPSEPIRVTLADSTAAALALPAGATAAGEAAGEAAAAVKSAVPAITIQPSVKLEKLSPPSAATPAAEDVAQVHSLASALRPLAFVSAQPADKLKPLGAAGIPAGDGSGGPFNPDAGGSTEPGPARPDGTYAPGARSKRGAGISGEGTGPGRAGGSATVGGRILTARADLAAQKTLKAPVNAFNGRAAFQGAIREIDVAGVPGDRLQEVLARYGIKMLAAPVEGGSITPRAFGQQQAVTRFSSGAIGIFRFSPYADGRMAELAEKALRENGYNPASTRIISVTFGIVANGQGYDLGVTHVRTEPLVVPQKRDYNKVSLPREDS